MIVYNVFVYIHLYNIQHLFIFVLNRPNYHTIFNNYRKKRDQQQNLFKDSKEWVIKLRYALFTYSVYSYTYYYVVTCILAMHILNHRFDLCTYISFDFFVFICISHCQESCHEFEQLIIVQCEALIQLIQERREFLLETLQMDKDNKLRILKVWEMRNTLTSTKIIMLSWWNFYCFSIIIIIIIDVYVILHMTFLGTTNKLHWKITTNDWPNTILHRSTQRDW